MTPTRGLQPDDGTRIESLAVLAHVLRGPLAEIERAQAVIRGQLELILRFIEDIQNATGRP